MVRKTLGIFEVFLRVFEKTKEKKDRVCDKRFCRTFGCTFWCDLSQNPCFHWAMTGNPLELFRNSLVLFVRFFGFVKPLWLRKSLSFGI